MKVIKTAGWFLVLLSSAVALAFLWTAGGLGKYFHKDDYTWQGQDQDALLSLFEEKPELFEQVVQAVIANEETFWETRQETESKAQLMSPNDDIMNVFPPEDQECIRRFFNETRPYMLSLRERREIRIDYINADKTDGYTFSYYYGDKTAVNEYGRSDWQDWITYTQGNYPYFTDLGNGWYFYYK